MDAELERPLLVLDSWPVLEWIKGREPCSSRFASILDSARAGDTQLEMSRINYGEVIYSIRKATDIASRQSALDAFLALPIRLHSLDDELVDAAVELKCRYPFAIADAFAASVAMRRAVSLVTGDREFLALERDGLLQVRWVGK